MMWAVPLVEWQSLQVAAKYPPPRDDLPWILLSKNSTGFSKGIPCFLTRSMSSWHLPQVVGMFKGLTLDSLTEDLKTSWLPWQS